MLTHSPVNLLHSLIHSFTHSLILHSAFILLNSLLTPFDVYSLVMSRLSEGYAA
jgi:hypothetical protein